MISTHRLPILLLTFCAACAVGGVVASDRRLTKTVRDRERRMLAEFWMGGLTGIVGG
jgi:site-specific recombinase